MLRCPHCGRPLHPIADCTALVNGAHVPTPVWECHSAGCDYVHIGEPFATVRDPVCPLEDYVR